MEKYGNERRRHFFSKLHACQMITHPNTVKEANRGTLTRAREGWSIGALLRELDFTSFDNFKFGKGFLK